LVGFLLLGVVVSSVKPGLTSAIAALPSKVQSIAYQYLSISPSQETIVARTQVLPGTGGDLHHSRQLVSR
jgi:hypothetical protein